MTRRLFVGLFMMLGVLAIVASTAAAQMPQTTQQKVKGEATVTTQKLTGEVVKVEGNTLIVKMANGQLRTFSNVPDSTKAIVDGKEVGVRDLQPGTKLTATITKTTTPVTVRTTTVGSGRVAYVMGNTVILTLPNGENKQYQVKPDYKFIVNGQPAGVHDLRQGMTVSAEKIVEEPTVEIATNSKVVGHAPAAQVAERAAGQSQPSARTSTRAHAAPAPTSEQAAAGAPAAAHHPAKLPKTGSPMPLIAGLGFLLLSAGFAMRMLRQS